MQTECARCHKTMDSVQGYKFGASQYLCMSCYDKYKAERAAKAKKQHKNPLIDQFGKEGPRPPSPEAQKAEMARPEPPQPEKRPPPPRPAPAAETCDVCKKPISDFKVPLKGGKKVCIDCNEVLREVAKSLIVNVQCPHCGKEIKLAQD